MRCVIAGSGVIGLSIARNLSKIYETILIESNITFGTQTSSRNSEVLHAGIYYQKDSLKAKLCVESVRRLDKYLTSRSIPYNKCGKLIVATNSKELIELEILHQKAISNGVLNLKKLSQTDVKYLEPEVFCVGALWSPSTSIFDSHNYMLNLLSDAESNGLITVYNCEVLNIDIQSIQFNNSKFIVNTNQGEIECNIFINCCGLAAQKIKYFTTSKNSLNKEYVQMVNDRIPNSFFLKGNYFRYSGGKLFKHLVYPIPDKEKNVLGIHSTIDLSGQTKFGPDAVWVKPKESDPFNGQTCDLRVENTEEKRIMFFQSIQKYYPNIKIEDISPDYCGIRPKLFGPNHVGPLIDKYGRNLMDFMIEGPQHHGIYGLVNLYGIESPGLTSSLAIADYVQQLLGLKVENNEDCS